MGYARVVDQDIDASKPFDYAGHRSLALFGAGNVAGDCHVIDALGTEIGGKRFQTLRNSGPTVPVWPLLGQSDARIQNRFLRPRRLLQPSCL